MEILEHAQQRTLQFIAFVEEEVRALGLSSEEELFLVCAKLSVPVLENPNQHYELREQVAGAFSSAAYKYVTRKWKSVADVIS